MIKGTRYTERMAINLPLLMFKLMLEDFMSLDWLMIGIEFQCKSKTLIFEMEQRRQNSVIVLFVLRNFTE